MASAGQSVRLTWTVAVHAGRALVDGRLLDHLRQRFSESFIIQKPVDVADGQGGTTRTWQQVAVWIGAMETLSATEVLADRAIQQNSTHRLSGAYRADVNSSMRVLYGNRVFLIQGVIDAGEQHIITQLLVEELTFA